MSIQEISNFLDNTPYETSPSLVSVDLNNFLSMELPQRELILNPWLPKAGLCMIHAKTGIGKTHISLNVAYAVACGGDFLGWEAEKPRGVLFIDGEMPAMILQERLKNILKMNRHTEFQEEFKIITPDLQEIGIPDIATLEGQSIINQHITDGVDLIILDNLSCLVKSGKENESESWEPIQTWLLNLRRQGKSVLLIHHAGKSGSQRGASKRLDVLDSVIYLERPEGYTQDEGARFNVVYEKNRGFCGDDAKSFEASLVCDHQGNLIWKTNSLKETTYQQVVRLLNTGMTQEQIAKELSRNPSTISRHANKAYSEGLIKVSNRTKNN